MAVLSLNLSNNPVLKSDAGPSKKLGSIGNRPASGGRGVGTPSVGTSTAGHSSGGISFADNAKHDTKMDYTEVKSLGDVINYIKDNAQPGSIENYKASIDRDIALTKLVNNAKEKIGSTFDVVVDKVEKSLGNAIVNTLNGQPTPGINSGKDAGKAGTDYSYTPVVSASPSDSIGGDNVFYATAGGASDLGYNDIVSAIRDTSAANTAASQAMAERQMAWQEEQNAKAMEFNSAEAQKNRDWQEYMSNSAHQREVADMLAAGINPVLSVTGGNGATVTSGATASGVTSSGSKGDVDTSLSGALSSIFNNLINAKISQNIAQINANSAKTVAGINAAASAYSANASADAVRYSANMNSVSRALGSVLGLFK